jgi:O-acetyl-ADP-ribose deacetylase (regulator of RNase III)
MDNVKLILADPNAPLFMEWKEHFADLPNVDIVHGYFEHIGAFDCVVSAANSFGIMDGGVDAAITRFFGYALMQRVQQRILDEFLGEQPVGTSLIVETGKAKHPFVAHTPTMRVPMPISRTDNVYTAMWAMLLAVRRHNLHADQQIEIVVCPGLGTGVGQMPFREAARQMALAYRHYLAPPKAIGWRYATQRQDAIRVGGDLGLAVRGNRPAPE